MEVRDSVVSSRLMLPIAVEYVCAAVGETQSKIRERSPTILRVRVEPTPSTIRLLCSLLNKGASPLDIIILSIVVASTTACREGPELCRRGGGGVAALNQFIMTFRDRSCGASCYLLRVRRWYQSYPNKADKVCCAAWTSSFTEHRVSHCGKLGWCSSW